MFTFGFIIPTHNSEKYIYDCLNSINNQNTTLSIKIIVVDDDSQDDTIKIIENYKFKDNITLDLYQNKKVKKQGFSRNFGLSLLDTDYVMFLDSDDFINEEAINKTVTALNNYQYDILFLDWIYFSDKNQKYNYTMSNNLLATEYLFNEDCANILSFDVYFTTPAFYNVKYLKRNQIKYGEGYIYEDYEFMVQNAMKANSIYFVHYPLYCVRINEKSTTKTNYKTSIHYFSFIEAINNSLKYLQNRSEYAIYYFYEYVIKKMFQYSFRRMTLKYRFRMISKTLLLIQKNSKYPVPENTNSSNKVIFNNNKFLIYKYLNGKFKVLPKKVLNKSKNKLKNKFKYKNKNKKEILVEKGKIVFLGFDFDFRGNSKYLYQYLKNNNYNNIYFLKKDENLYYHLNSAEYVIFESWNQLGYRKKDNQKFIQLWHGSPLKRITFASNEPLILKRNPNSRKNKFKDYSAWDYLLVDNTNDKKIFDECFPYHNYQYLEAGYPRVKYLIDNNKPEIINNLKKKHQITKPLVLYVPTWRDSQLISSEKNWLLDVKELEKKFTDYQFLSFEHLYLNDKKYDIDIQQLILISDIIISDYSSIVFDGVAINKKTLLYQPDLEQFEKERGLFESQMEYFKNNVVYNINDLEYYLKDSNLIPEVKIENIINYNKTYEMFLDIFNRR